MSTQVTFTCPGTAKTERKRQKFFRNAAGQVKVGSRVDEPDRADFKSRLAFYAANAFSQPLTGPVGLRLHVRRPKPPSYPKKATTAKPWPWADTTKGGGDCDNYAKICQDALNGIAFLDDAQIIDLRVEKTFGVPGVTVTVWTIEQEPEPGGVTA